MNMDNLKSMISGVKGLLLAAAGLLIIAQIVIGNAGPDVVNNLQELLNGFIGSGASLVSVITGIIVLGLLTD